MATTRENARTKLLLAVESGLGSDGSAKISQRTIQNVNPSITDEDAYDVAAAIGSLQAYTVNGVSRQDTTALVRE